MLRFRIGPIPVLVHPSHFLFSALMGFSSAGNLTPLLQAREVAVWVGVVFFSVLIHELGHAGVALAFGYRPDIQLVLLGGVTRPNAPGPIPWVRDVGLTLAGPIAGLSLAGLCRVVQGQLGPSFLASEVLGTFYFANLVWGLMNLAPVPPLDGGHITVAVLRRFFGRGGEIAALVLGAVVAGAVALVFSRAGYYSGAVLFAAFGFRAASAALSRWRAPAQAPAGDPSLLHAQTLLDAGRLDEAEAAAMRLNVADAPVAVRAASERLLGWIALKRGEGRVALDHFSQVSRAQGARVEPQALAAAFSLVGDDARALTLWEQAYRETSSVTVLHEWAGALIRLGRTQQALALPGVQAASAYVCAERVLFLRGDFLGSARTGEDALQVAPTAETAYDAACAYARAGKPDDALRLLHRAISLGFRDAAFAGSDEDLAALHAHPEWPSVLGQMANSSGR